MDVRADPASGNHPGRLLQYRLSLLYSLRCSVSPVLASSQQAESFAKCNGCASIIHTELAIDMFCMQFDCFGCDNQFACNLLVCEVCIEHMQNLQFTPGQWFQTLFHQEIFLRTSLYRDRVYRRLDGL